MNLSEIFLGHLTTIRLFTVSLVLFSLMTIYPLYAAERDLVAVGGDGLCVASKDVSDLKDLLGARVYLPPDAWEKETLRIKLFALAAAKSGLISDEEIKGAEMKDLVKFASLYKRHLLKSWRPSDLAIVSYYRANRFSFPGHDTLDADLRAMLEDHLRRAAGKKIYFQAVRNLEIEFKVHWCDVDDSLCRDANVSCGL